MATWWSELITPEHPLAHLDPQLPIANGELIIKSQYDAFYNTSLETILQKQAVTQVVICGVMTHLCCETTVRSAFIRGYEVLFPIDGTATYNRHFHLATLTNLAHGFTSIVTMDDLLEEVLIDET
jgi:nicotinamidase-related amidase